MSWYYCSKCSEPLESGESHECAPPRPALEGDGLNDVLLYLGISGATPEMCEKIVAAKATITALSAQLAEALEAEKTKCTCINMVIEGRCSYCLDREIVRLTRLAHQLSAQLVDQKAEAYKFSYEAYAKIAALEKALGEARQEIEEMKDNAYHAGIERDLAT
jgi:hypothetical protein